jgi:trk system potassium uptake protein TrkA
MKKRQIVVVGLGQFGLSVATSFTRLGHDVLGLDIDSSKVRAADGIISKSIECDTTNRKAVEELGLSEINVALVAIGSGNLEANILTTTLFKNIGIEFVSSRSLGEIHNKTLEYLGVNVLHPEENEGSKLARRIFIPYCIDFMSLGGKYGIAKIVVPAKMSGKNLKEIGFSTAIGRRDLALLALRRSDWNELNPDLDNPEFKLKEGDVLIASGDDERLEKLFFKENKDN